MVTEDAAKAILAHLGRNGLYIPNGIPGAISTDDLWDTAKAFVSRNLAVVGDGFTAGQLFIRRTDRFGLETSQPGFNIYRFLMGHDVTHVGSMAKMNQACQILLHERLAFRTISGEGHDKCIDKMDFSAILQNRMGIDAEEADDIIETLIDHGYITIVRPENHIQVHRKLRMHSNGAPYNVITMREGHGTEHALATAGSVSVHISKNDGQVMALLGDNANVRQVGRFSSNLAGTAATGNDIPPQHLWYRFRSWLKKNNIDKVVIWICALVITTLFGLWAKEHWG